MHKVTPIPAFDDNYIWLIHGKSEQHVAIVDPGDEVPVLAQIERNHLVPVAILCTHHHYDHVDGITNLLKQFDIPVYGPAGENIPNVTHRVVEGDKVGLSELGLNFKVLDVPGHTRGHVAYFAEDMLFCGDTLFSAGCGRLFEGTAEQMHESLSKIAALPGKTRCFPTHEYTLANLQFAQTVEPENGEIHAYIKEIKALREADKPSLPSFLAKELQINPFLRASEEAVRSAVSVHEGAKLGSPLEVFSSLRRWKDKF